MPLNSRKAEPEYRTYRLKDALPFGQYKGNTIDDVLSDDPGYLDWCLQNVEGFDLHAEVIDDGRWLDYQYPYDMDVDKNIMDGPQY